MQLYFPASPATHAQRLERWLGADVLNNISDATRDFYWHVPVANVPGKVYSYKGNFFGAITGGGFTSLGDLISEATAGKRQDIYFNKTGSTGVVAATNTLWYVGPQPAAGGNAGAAPGGSAFSASSTGALAPFSNPVGSDSLHFVTGNVTGTVAGNTLLLYDRLWSVTKTMNSTATEAVTGSPLRYVGASTASTAYDYPGGNFLMVECRTALAATAHNWTVCTYTDQDGNTAASLPSLTGNSGNIAQRLDHPTGQWFAPLASGDTGIKYLTQVQCSASVATGAVDFTIGHPLAFLPIPVANMICVTDGINSAFNLIRISDNACLSLLEITKPATTATTYNGNIVLVSG